MLLKRRNPMAAYLMTCDGDTAKIVQGSDKQSWTCVRDKSGADCEGTWSCPGFFDSNGGLIDIKPSATKPSFTNQVQGTSAVTCKGVKCDIPKDKHLPPAEPPCSAECCTPWEPPDKGHKLLHPHAASDSKTYAEDHIDTVYKYGPEGVLESRPGFVGSFQRYAYPLPEAAKGWCTDNNLQGRKSLPNGQGTTCKNFDGCKFWCSIMPKCRALTWWADKKWCSLSYRRELTLGIESQTSITKCTAHTPRLKYQGCVSTETPDSVTSWHKTNQRVVDLEKANVLCAKYTSLALKCPTAEGAEVWCLGAAGSASTVSDSQCSPPPPPNKWGVYQALADQTLAYPHVATQQDVYTNMLNNTVYQNGPLGVLKSRPGPGSTTVYGLPIMMKGVCEDNLKSGSQSLPNGTGTKCNTKEGCVMWCSLMPKCRGSTYQKSESWCSLSFRVETRSQPGALTDVPSDSGVLHCLYLRLDLKSVPRV